MKRRISHVQAIFLAASLLPALAAPAEEPVASVLLRDLENLTETEFWTSFSDIAPWGGGVTLLGWVGGSPGGSVVWTNDETVLRTPGLVVLAHPLANQGVEVFVKSIGQVGGRSAGGGLTLLVTLTCGDCALEGDHAVVHWSSGDSVDYRFGTADAMLLDGELITPSSILRIADARDGRVHALISWKVADVPLYALIASTDAQPPQHVEAVLKRWMQVYDEDGSILGEVFRCASLVEVLPWTGLPLTATEVVLSSRILRMYILLSNHVFRSATGGEIQGLEIARRGAGVLNERMTNLYTGRLVQQGDITEENDHFIALDEALVAREGDVCPGLDVWRFHDDDSFATECLLAMDDYGNAAFTWGAKNDAGDTQLVIYYNGALLLKAGDPIDANGDGVIDDGDAGSYLRRLAHETPLVLRRSGLYLLAEVFLTQYGFREVYLRIAPLPEIANAWNSRPPCPGDADGDLDVDQSDLGIVLAAYGSAYADPLYHPNADLNADGVIDQQDLGVVLANYETTCE